VLLAAGAAAAGLAGCEKLDARIALKQGNQYYLNEEYRRAIEQYQIGLAKDPSATFAWRSVGLSALALYKPGVKTAENDKYAATAIEAFGKYLKTRPKDAEKVKEYVVTTLINSERYDEALVELKAQAAHTPNKPGLNGAIVATFGRQHRLQEAYDWARQHPDAELFYSVGVSAWDRAYNDVLMDAEERGKVVDLGLESTKRAIDLRRDYFEAMAYYNLLFREKAKLEPDPMKAQEWYAKAQEWYNKAKVLIEAQKKKDEAAAKAPGAA
jgi:tetratricopeptide (TPR) repeat protein